MLHLYTGQYLFVRIWIPSILVLDNGSHQPCQRLVVVQIYSAIGWNINSVRHLPYVGFGHVFRRRCPSVYNLSYRIQIVTTLIGSQDPCHSPEPVLWRYKSYEPAVIGLVPFLAPIQMHCGY